MYNNGIINTSEMLIVSLASLWYGRGKLWDIWVMELLWGADKPFYYLVDKWYVLDTVQLSFCLKIAFEVLLQCEHTVVKHNSRISSLLTCIKPAIKL